MVKHHILCVFNPFKCVETYFMAQNMINCCHSSMCSRKECIFCSLKGALLYIYLLGHGQLLMVLFKSSLPNHWALAHETPEAPLSATQPELTNAPIKEGVVEGSKIKQ